MKRSIFLLMGLATLLLFPLPTIFYFYLVENKPISAIFQLDQLQVIPIFYGLEFGFIYAILASILLTAPVFERNPLPTERILKSLRITFLEALFLSFCAGFGEELLFRSGVQPFLGVFITSILFVAIHGYFSIKKPLLSYYGILVTPFIILLGYGYIHFGLWFAIAAHFMYDLVILVQFVKKKYE